MEYEWVVIGQGLMPLDKTKVNPNDLEPNGFFKIAAVLSHDDAAHLQKMPFSSKIRRVEIGAHPNGPHAVAKAAAKAAEPPQPAEPPSDMPKPPPDEPVAPAATPVVAAPPAAPAVMPKPPAGAVAPPPTDRPKTLS